MEEIAGPLFGFYLACYTVATAEGHYGYCKLFTQRPDSVWTSQHAVRKTAAGPCPDAVSALHAVVARCERRLARRQARARNDSDWAALSAAHAPLEPQPPASRRA